MDAPFDVGGVAGANENDGAGFDEEEDDASPFAADAFVAEPKLNAAAGVAEDEAAGAGVDAGWDAEVPKENGLAGGATGAAGAGPSLLNRGFEDEVPGSEAFGSCCDENELADFTLTLMTPSLTVASLDFAPKLKLGVLALLSAGAGLADPLAG